MAHASTADRKSRIKYLALGSVLGLGLLILGGVLLANNRSSSDIAETRAAASRVIAAVRLWHILHGDRLCPTVRQLVEAKQLDAKTLSNDPWGRSFSVKCSDLEVIVTSLGPDGNEHTSDDIVVREPSAAITNPE